jgi:hypothetical protein
LTIDDGVDARRGWWWCGEPGFVGTLRGQRCVVSGYAMLMASFGIVGHLQRAVAAVDTFCRVEDLSLVGRGRYPLREVCCLP